MYLNLFQKRNNNIKDIFQMSGLLSRSQIAKALIKKESKDPQEAREALKYLTASEKSDGYGLLLMNLANENDDTLKKCQALIQLKRHLKQNWSRRKSISIGERQQIKNKIINCFICSAQEHAIIKIFKEILSVITQCQMRNWSPHRFVLQKISNGQNISRYLHVLLGIAAAFQFSIAEEQKNCFSTIIQAAFPVLLQLLDKNKDSQRVYLCVKFLWKTVHYQISPTVKNLTFGWMPILQTIIGSTNPNYDNTSREIPQRGSEKFFYFHSKKWATRIFLRFIQKHAKKISFVRNESNIVFAQKWYADYGYNLVSILIEQFSISTTTKVRYFQLKCVQSLIGERAQLIQEYADFFQKNILLNYLRLNQQDEKLAIERPTALLQKQSSPVLNFNQLKIISTNVWIAFSELGSQKQKSNPGIYFYKNLEYLKGKLQEKIQRQIELALYLICSMANHIQKFSQSHQIIKMIIIEHVIPNFNAQNMFIRARTLELFSKYYYIKIETNIAEKALEGIICCILKEKCILVQMKAISAFSFAIKIKCIKNLAIPILRPVLDIALHILESYGQQINGSDIQVIVGQFCQHITQFAFDLIVRLSQIYFKLANQDRQMVQNIKQYDGQFQLAASKCLKTIVKIIQSPLPSEILLRIQQPILSILQFIFMGDLNDYMEDYLILLKVFLHKVKILSSKIWFYFQAVVYNIIGFPKERWNQLYKLFPQKQHYHIISKFRIRNDNEMLEKSAPALRNYIWQVSLMKYQPNYEEYKTTLISLLFHLINEVYKIGLTQYSGEINIIICTALMVCLLQNFQKALPQNVYIHIWEFSKINLIKFGSAILKSFNSQLLGLLLWVNPLSIITVSLRQNMLPNIVTQITRLNYEFSHQRVRVILGINSALMQTQRPAFSLPQTKALFAANLKLVQNNIDQRLEIQTACKLQTINVEGNNLNNMDEEDNLWIQEYYDHYFGPLNLIDQIWDFQDTLEKLNNQQNHLYHELVRSVPEGKVANLRQKLRTVTKKSQ